jgi:nucleoid-associated protein YgaU
VPNYYDEENIVINEDELYENFFKNRGVKFIEHYRTKTFDKIKTKNITVRKHTWTYGDTMHKLAFKFFGNTQLWWTIGMVNKKPTDAYFTIGDVIYIPVSPSELVRK